MHITVTNLSVEEAYDIDAVVIDRAIGEIKGEILTNEMHAMNTFEEPDVVKTENFDKVTVTDKGLSFTIPACSVIHLAVK